MVFGENCVNNPGEIYYENLYSYINSNIEQLEVIKNKYSKLLSELTICEELDNDTFYCKLKEINSMGTIIIAYKYLEENSIEYSGENPIEIVGSGTIIIEPKIIHGAKSVGHIEDIVVKSNCRGKKISQSILCKLKEFAYSKNCYKVILDCDESVCPVYRSNGFEVKGVQMGQYF
jgi:glucosamine-phosphate N-acetyltransferase